MELFNGLKNKYFTALTEIINEIKKNGYITRKQFEEKLFPTNEKESDKKSSENRAYNYTILQELLNDSNIFEIENVGKLDDNKISLKIEASIPVLSNKAERIWLLTALESDVALIFFSEDEREKLRSILRKQCEPMNADFFADTEYKMPSPKRAAHIRLLLKAIHENKKIYYRYKDNKRKLYSGVTTPMKVEYSKTNGAFYLSHRPDDQNRPIKSYLNGILEIRILDEAADIPPILNAVEERKVPQKLEFDVIDPENKYGAVNRAKILFSQYNRLITETESCVHFSIEYYTFQEKELIYAIMLFGPRIKVISPPNIIDEIKKRIEKASQTYLC